MRSMHAIAFAVATALSACHAQTPIARVDAPPGPSLTSAPAACLADASEPFVFDWPSERRADLEVALRGKVVVLNVTCTAARILPDCTADGAYTFVGTSAREDHISLRSPDEVAANLPLSAPKLTGPGGVDFGHGSSLDLAYATIGRRTSAHASLQRADLKGECNGATHFVRAATLGAFTIGTGGSGPHSEIAKDGSLDACRAATPGAEKEVAQCGAPVRVRLGAIKEAGLAATAVPSSPNPDGVELASCAPGMVRGEAGACERPTADRPHICVASDVADCAQQCDHGSPTSCAILGRSYEQGRGVPKDPARAAELLAKACAGGAYPACGRLGEQAIVARDSAKGVQLLTQACNGGWLQACREVGTYAVQHSTVGLTTADLFHRGCAGGDAESCWSLGLLTLAGGGGLQKDDAAAARWMDLACQGGANLGCSDYVKLLDAGRGVPADPARAVALLTKACDGGNAVACNDLSTDYVTGHSVAKDLTKGITLLERSCVLGNTGQCVTIAMRYERGIGVPADPTKAALYYSKACQAGIPTACAKVQGKP